MWPRHVNECMPIKNALLEAAHKHTLSWSAAHIHLICCEHIHWIVFTRFHCEAPAHSSPLERRSLRKILIEIEMSKEEKQNIFLAAGSGSQQPARWERETMFQVFHGYCQTEGKAKLTRARFNFRTQSINPKTRNGRFKLRTPTKPFRNECSTTEPPRPSRRGSEQTSNTSR